MISGNKEMSIKDFYEIVFNNKEIEIEKEVIDRVNKSFYFLEKFSKDKIIYGINTGFGPMAQYKIDDIDKSQLQYNLIRSHASGTGKIISKKCIKASMLVRLNTLCIGNSGVNESVIHLLKNLINKNILPLIYEHGGVGASGDLVQLAHIALALIGEGNVYNINKKEETKIVFEKENLKPMDIKLREGLALMNGTSVMTGIGLVNIIYAKRLLDWMIFCSSIINEIVSSFDDHFSFELNQTKKHIGQREIAKKMRKILVDSKLIRKRNKFLYTVEANGKSFFEDKIQEYYSLRCVPQILGPILDTLNYCENILINELNSTTDNPITDINNQEVYHGGNFHGDYVSLEMDKLKIVVAKMTMLSERQLNFLLNPKLNHILPPFMNLGKLGLNFGMQGAQFTATSTTAENQMLSNPMYIHSIPNNNDNQDIVSMGANAALITNKVINNAYEVISVEITTIIKAIEYLKIEKKISTKNQIIYNKIKKIVPNFEEDNIIYEHLNEMKKYIMENNI